MSVPAKVYLGDGVYASFDGYAFVLTTENGIDVTNTIVLEPQVFIALEQYVNRLDPPRRVRILGDIIFTHGK